jgi:ribose/xylose/arabinose/galactoside ABC-type transport system permease subunit
MNRKKIILIILNNLIWILLLGVVIMFGLLSDRFLTQTNITNIFVHAAVLGILVVGQSFTLVTGNFDLSMESTLAVCALVGAWLILPAGAPTFGGGVMLSPYLAIPILLMVGVSIGWLNGMLITKLKMNAFIVTLAMLIVLRGVIMIIAEGNTLTRLPDTFKFLGSAYVGPIPVAVIALVLAFFVAHIIMQYRPLGRSLYAVGGTKNAALAAGIDPDKRIRYVYLMSGFMAAIAGLMLAGRTGVVVENMGRGMIFEVFAAAVIGGISLQGGRGTMVGAFGGVLLLSTIRSGLSLLRVSSFWIEIMSGLIILIAMLIDAQKVRYTSQSGPKIKSDTQQAPATAGD